ncbi:DUF2249 domain-containing protein [Halorubrum sp. CBA1125]|uniref:DUF2249 domain-containing protein n=1 Tax=Halorubrum sp. CBA1125 TaxID=2668072 RepID=UPI0012E89B59|nr:DUF2249 domain-containing protein [Halorubrum sp. CBA1125]MUW13994.1 DUF2249 domain-containing protein [Halorubrum sp. CBA1125]
MSTHSDTIADRVAAARAQVDPTTALERTDAPSDAGVETIDVRELGPPKPLKLTLERIEDLPAGTVLIQYNDRAPQFLFPKLADRGYAHDIVEVDGTVVTAIWRPSEPAAGGGSAETGAGDTEADADGTETGATDP